MGSLVVGSSYYSFPPLEVMTNKVKEREENNKRLSIYLSSKGRHEVGDIEFLIVQSFKEPPGVVNSGDILRYFLSYIIENPS